MRELTVDRISPWWWRIDLEQGVLAKTMAHSRSTTIAKRLRRRRNCRFKFAASLGMFVTTLDSFLHSLDNNKSQPTFTDRNLTPL
jgi:hypothetical protein